MYTNLASIVQSLLNFDSTVHVLPVCLDNECHDTDLDCFKKIANDWFGDGDSGYAPAPYAPSPYAAAPYPPAAAPYPAAAPVSPYGAYPYPYPSNHFSWILAFLSYHSNLSIYYKFSLSFKNHIQSLHDDSYNSWVRLENL